MKKKGVASLIVATTMVTGNLAMAATNDGKVSEKNNINKKDVNTSPSPIINGIKVNKMLIDKNFYRDLTINPKYIVIHDTDNRAYGAGAIANRNYFANHDDADASAHYIVDDKNIVQALEDDWFGWHIGDKYKGVTPKVPDAKNNNSIGIEITVNPDSDFDVAMKNAIELVKYLMAKHNIPAENVIRHNDATGKICPRMMIQDRPYLWDVFKNAIGSKVSAVEIEGQYGIVKDEEAVVNTYEAQDVYREMNVSRGVIGTVDKNKKVKVNYVKDSWANITFLNEKGKSLTGFTKVYNLKINNLEMINKTSEIIGNGQVSVYKNLNGTPFEYIKNKTRVTYNYLYKKWANITYINLEGKTINGFVLSSQVKINENLDRGNSSISGKSAKVINASAVNVREDGKLGSSIIGLVYRNEEVKVNFSKGEWTNVTFTTFDGTTKTGYMKSEYIYINSITDSNKVNSVEDKKDNSSSSNKDNSNISNTENKVLSTEGKVTNVTSSLRIRSGAGTNYDILGFLSNDSMVNINGKLGGWYKINYNNIEGYVSEEYIATTTSSNNKNNNTSTEGNNSNNSSSNKNTSNGGAITLNKLGEVINVSTALKIRQGAGQQYEVLGWLRLGNKVNLISKEGQWYKINTNGIIGFVHSDYLKEIDLNSNNSVNSSKPNNNDNVTLNKGKIINVETNLRVRSSMDVSSNIVGYLTKNQTVDIISKYGDWYKISFDTYSVKKEGFIQSKYVELFKETTTNNKGYEVVKEAKKYIGIDYLWGGSTPIGFDCSGLTSYVYKKLNVNIGRTTWEQIKNGKVVSISAMREGDLIFFGSSSDPKNPTHVGIYVGNGSFLHSPKRGEKVTITKLADYKGCIIQANRYI